MKKYLALIEPLQNPIGMTAINCNVKFVTGELAHHSKIYCLPTNIFRYHFWGYTFETVVLNDNGTIIEVHDPNKEDQLNYNVRLLPAVTYNNVTHEVLALDGFVYSLDESPFASYCRPMLHNIYREIACSQVFCLVLYTLDGAVFSLLFDKDFPKSSSSYKYALMSGYVPADKNTLCQMVPRTQEDLLKNEKLSQDEIDKLIAGMNRGFN